MSYSDNTAFNVFGGVVGSSFPEKLDSDFYVFESFFYPNTLSLYS